MLRRRTVRNADRRRIARGEGFATGLIDEIILSVGWAGLAWPIRLSRVLTFAVGLWFRIHTRDYLCNLIPSAPAMRYADASSGEV